MKPLATLANALWYASNLQAWRAFRRSLHHPEQTQTRIFRDIIRRASRTAFGREHGITADCNYEMFCQRVPLRTYEDLQPWIARIQNGEQNVLTVDPVRRLATTSGTTAGRKLIPYTWRFQSELNCAVAPWIVDLFHKHPTLFCGRAYWSISPVAQRDAEEHSAVPIGFEDDSEYLGGIRRHLVDAVLAVPSTVRHITDINEWRRQTVAYLKTAPDLRLISIWHPSFLDLLFQDTGQSHQFWPNLAMISCWGDGHSAHAAADLARKYPGVYVQPKGLLATEGVVSIPFEDRWPLAIRSHFLEFIDERREVHRAHQLTAGRQYEVVLTTSGGLYRYRLGDLVQVDSFLHGTPSIRFLGKTGQVSDRYGEKLAEPFVANVLNRLQAQTAERWPFALLAPDGRRYCLFIDGVFRPTLAAELDDALRANPHYAYCRELGQLQPCVIAAIPNAQLAFFKRMTQLGQRMGDIKPAALSNLDGWREWFETERGTG